MKAARVNEHVNRIVSQQTPQAVDAYVASMVATEKPDNDLNDLVATAIQYRANLAPSNAVERGRK